MKERPDLEQEKNRNFFMIPTSLVDSGLLAQMSKAEIKIYLTIARFAHYKSGNAFPSFKRIREMTRIWKNKIGIAEKNLVNFGLIKMRRAPGAFKFRNVFKVLRNPEIMNLISPVKRDKRKAVFRQKDGKFGVSPVNTESDTSPVNTESDTSPQKRDKKEIEIDIKRDSIKRQQRSISKEILIKLREEMGEEWLKNYMKEQGYDLSLLEEEKLKEEEAVK
jgi:hypothetical protein